MSHLTTQLARPYETPHVSPATPSIDRVHRTKQISTPLDYEVLRATLAKLVFTRMQAVELVGHILDNVKER